MSKRFALLALAVVSFTLPLAAGNGALSIGKPDDLGFSPERLARVRRRVSFLETALARMLAKGVSSLVVTNGAGPSGVIRAADIVRRQR